MPVKMTGIFVLPGPQTSRPAFVFGRPARVLQASRLRRELITWMQEINNFLLKKTLNFHALNHLCKTVKLCYINRLFFTIT
jgi:hypothetical protein